MHAWMLQATNALDQRAGVSLFLLTVEQYFISGWGVVLIELRVPHDTPDGTVVCLPAQPTWFACPARGPAVELGLGACHELHTDKQGHGQGA